MPGRGLPQVFQPPLYYKETILFQNYGSVDMAADLWVNLLTNFGLATVIILALGAGTWKTLGWIGRELILPLRDQWIKRGASFFDNLEDVLAKIGGNVDTMSGLLDKQTQLLGSLQKSVEHSAEGLAELRTVVKVWTPFLPPINPPKLPPPG